MVLSSHLVVVSPRRYTRPGVQAISSVWSLRPGRAYRYSPSPRNAATSELATDEDAAGTPPSPEELALARANAPREDVPTDVNRSAPTARRHALPSAAIALLIGVAVLVAAVLAWYALP